MRQRLISGSGRSVVTVELTAVEDSPKVAVVEIVHIICAEELVIDCFCQWESRK